MNLFHSLYEENSLKNDKIFLKNYKQLHLDVLLSHLDLKKNCAIKQKIYF